MHVGVGSRNPVKVEAVATVLERTVGGTAAPVDVDSGVPEQPRGRPETVAGARNRARRALAAGEYDLGVGLEGGVDRPGDPPGTYLIMWAAATDGDRIEYGGGPALRLPESIAAEIEAGAELGPVLDERLGTEGIAEDRGAAGVLSGGAIDRTSALAHAVAGALGPFVAPEYDR